MKRPFFLYLLLFLHLFLGLGAVYGGGMLVVKPDGSLLGMNTKWLGDTPFNTYLIPGLFLFTMVGLWSLFTFVGLLLKPEWSWANIVNIYPDKHWAWTYSLYSGIIVIFWITAQQVLTQYFWLQPVTIFVGMLIIIFTLSPSVIKKFEIYDRKNQ